MSAATRRVVSQPTKSTYIGHSVKTIAGKPGEPLRKVKATEEIATAEVAHAPLHSTRLRPSHGQRCRKLPCVRIPVVLPLPVLLRPADEALLERWRWFVQWSLVQRREVSTASWRRFRVVHGC